MKRLMVSAIAVLLMAAAARAQNVSMSWSLTSGTDRDPATPVFDAMPGDVFTATLHLETDVGLLGWNAKFLNPAGWPVQPAYLVGGGWDTNTAATAIPWVGTTLPLGTYQGTGLLGSSPTGASAGSGPIFQLVLTVPVMQAPGTAYVTATGASAADQDFSDYFLTVAPLPINVLPDPTRDSDGDGVRDVDDNCPNKPNSDQTNSDEDSLGDACDNCPDHTNPDQADCDHDGKGDVCAVADGTSQDCNANGVPDECESDADGDGVIDACDPPIVAWRGVRFHSLSPGLGVDLSIPLDPTATGNGRTGPTVETRRDGIRQVEVDFDRAIQLNQASGIVAEDMMVGMTYPATSVSLANGNTTLIIKFADGLPDKACYRIDLADHIVNLAGDSDCLIRSLVGDVNGGGTVTSADVTYVKSKIGEDVFPDNICFDVNVGLSINSADLTLVKSRVGNTVVCPE
jgi:hypothetical protein